MLWLWIAAVGAVLIFLLLFACFCLRAAFGRRCEGDPSLKYFTNADFPGLEAAPVSFQSNKGQLLRGAVYTRPGAGEPVGLAVFAHGMGGGHLSYTTEINTIAAAGFAVLAYDGTGTMASEGKSLGGFYQSVRDLRAALAFARSDAALSRYKPVIIGHSWGGYAVCQALAYEEDNVSGAVAFSAPSSAVAAICDSISGMAGLPCGWLRPFFALASVIMDGRDSLRSGVSVLSRTDQAPVLLLQGDADPSVRMGSSPVSSIDVREKGNITCIVYPGRAHNVYQTAESERYLGKVMGEISRARKKYGKAGIPEEEKARLYDIDYQLITREDPAVMKTVTDFMRGCVERG